MSPEITAAILQGGAVILLAYVLFAISKKIDKLIDITNNFVLKLIAIIELTAKDSATRTQEQSNLHDETIQPPQ